jgi:hypothetical protein
MNFKIGLISLIALALFIWLHSRLGKNHVKGNCNKNIMTQFHCIVVKKEILYDQHGTREITCKDLDSGYMFYFYPNQISPPNIFYDKIEVGDTLLKGQNEMQFLIINNKRDTFKFDCKYGSRE